LEEKLIVHVDPKDREDRGDGSADRPLKTIAAAQNRVREHGRTTGSRWARIEIKSCDVSEPIVLGPEDSGDSPEHPITYAVGRIRGGQWVKANFQTEGKLWVARLPESTRPFRDLWINGRRAIRARAPNKGFFRVAKPGDDNRTSFSAEANDFLSLAHPESSELVFLHDWSISRVRLASADAATHTYRFADAIGCNAPHFAITNFEPHPRYFIENAPELLDAPGEWYFDEAKRELRYWPREDESLNVVSVVIPIAPQLVVLRGENGKPVRNVTFEGIEFEYTRFDPPAHGFAEAQANWHERRADDEDRTRVDIPAAVLLDGADNCRFVDCKFGHLGGAGLQVTHSQNVSIERCKFRDIGGNGVLIGASLKDEGPVTQNVSIENSLIDRCGQTYFGAVGLWVGISADTRAQHNEIRNLPYTGVSVGWCWGDRATACRGNLIRDNHIHHVVQLLSDGGGIYTLGRQPGTRLAGNVIHDIPANAGRAESNGIFMDQGSNEIRVQGNTIYNIARSPIRFNEAGKNTFERNRLASSPGVPAFAYRETKATDQEFRDNEEIEGAEWQPPANDPEVKEAGIQPLPE